MQYDPMFEKIIGHILKSEGGYVNHPADKGKATKFGISQKSYPKLDIKNLTIDQAKKIYYDNYYKPIKNLGAKDPRSLTTLVDLAINSGVGRAKEFHKKFNDNYDAIMQARNNYYKNIIAKDPSQKIFEQGWFNRLKNVDKFVKSNFAQPVQPQEVPNTLNKENVKQPELVLPNLHKVKDIVTDYTFGMQPQEQSKPETQTTQKQEQPSHVRNFIENLKAQKEKMIQAQQQQLQMAQQKQEEERQRALKEQRDAEIQSLIASASKNISSLGQLNQSQGQQQAPQNPYGTYEGWV